MKNLSKDYVIDRMIDIIAHMQLNGEHVPELDNELIDQIAQEFMYELEMGYGTFSDEFDDTLQQYLVYEFNKNFFKSNSQEAWFPRKPFVYLPC